MLTELNLFKEFAICYIDELRDVKKSEWQIPRRFAFLKKASSLDLSISAIAGSAYYTLDKIEA